MSKRISTLPTIMICTLIFLFAALDVKAKNTDVDLYALNEAYSEYLSIPSSYRQSYDIGSGNYDIIEGDSITIEDGIVKPRVEVWYYYQTASGNYVGSSEPTGQEGEEVSIEYIFGDSIVELVNGDTITFHVRNYAVAYSDNVMDTYLKNNITDGMTQYEMAVLCCEFVAGYDYGVNSSSSTGMIVTGSGDCWASADALLYMLEKLGIACDYRDASGGIGAGSGHINVMARMDGKYYILDAGYTGTAPRYYHIEEYSTTFAYSELSENTISIHGFVNLDDLKEVVVPKVIDGYTVVKIGNNAFSGMNNIEKIVLPDTLTSLGDKCFYQMVNLKAIQIPPTVTSVGNRCLAYCETLEEIQIPASVKELGEGCLEGCYALKNISVASDNTQYCSVDGILFTKDMSTIVAYPPGRVNSSYQIPFGVKSIANTAFAHTSFESLTLPDSLTDIGVNAFWRAEMNELIVPSSMTTIGVGAFAGGDGIRMLYIPASVQNVDSYGLALGYGSYTVGGFSNAKERSIVCFAEGCKINFAEQAFSGALYGVVPGSDMHSYVKENSFSYVETNTNGKIPLKEEWFEKLEDSEYNGYEQTRRLEWTDQAPAFYFKENRDYQISFKNNKNPGTASMVIQGIGMFEGTVALNFEIVSEESESEEPQTEVSKNNVQAGQLVNKLQASYKVNSDGKTVTYIKTKKAKAKIVIPDSIKINGKSYKVKSIAKGAFKNNKKITNVVIGKNITSIGTKAFYNCKKLKTVTIKSKKLILKKVGVKAFAKTNTKMKIKVPKSKLKAYRTILLKRGISKKATITK